QLRVLGRLVARIQLGIGSGNVLPQAPIEAPAEAQPGGQAAPNLGRRAVLVAKPVAVRVYAAADRLHSLGEPGPGSLLVEVGKARKEVVGSRAELHRILEPGTSMMVGRTLLVDRSGGEAQTRGEGEAPVRPRLPVERDRGARGQIAEAGGVLDRMAPV